MSAIPKQRLTSTEYLVIERKAEFKSEFYDGEMFAMTGASLAHNVIVANLCAGLHQQLSGKPCQVLTSDMRTKVGASGLYTYPDVVVVRGKPAIEDEELDTLTNPTLLD
jgi:Uma2 family endonuclease